MNDYKVTFDMAGKAEIRVKAENEKEALEIAEDAIKRTDFGELKSFTWAKETITENKKEA